MKQESFTLIELLVVIAVIGLISSIILVSLKEVRGKARDATRLEQMRQIILAVELFYNKYERYPDSSDGIPSGGECVGSDAEGATAFESVVSEFIPSVPKDPNHSCNCDSCGDDEFYYAYDPYHSGCEPVISINRFETQAFLDEYGQKDTSSGTDMNIDTAHYNYCFIK